MRFENKRVIVTGGAAGFGEAISRQLASEGARVVVSDINGDGAESVAAELDGAIAHQLDVTDEDGTKAMMERVAAEWGGIDVVVANAGLPHLAGPALGLETADFDRMWEINVRSIFFAAKYGVPHMAPGSSIVITASIAARRQRPNTVPYGASKAAALALMKGLAVELAPNIRVNAVNPVSAPTGFDLNAVGTPELHPKVQAAIIKGIPMGRRATPEDVAMSVAFLASDDAAFLTGVGLDVDGGRSIG